MTWRVSDGNGNHVTPIDPLIDQLSRAWIQLPEEEALALLPRFATLLPRLFPVLGRVPVVAGARGRLALADPQQVRVITSYSIHYTKLYDIDDEGMLFIFFYLFGHTENCRLLRGFFFNFFGFCCR